MLICFNSKKICLTQSFLFIKVARKFVTSIYGFFPLMTLLINPSVHDKVVFLEIGCTLDFIILKSYNYISNIFLKYFTTDKDYFYINFLFALFTIFMCLSFRNKGYSYFFESLISIRKKKVVDLESTLNLRNILGTARLEVSFSYFYNRIFFMRINNFKRKKLFYVRHNLNKACRVT